MATACSVVLANDVHGLGSSGVGLRTHAATNCVLMVVSVVSICALVVCGVLVVREYSLAMSYLPTNCRIRNITYAPKDVVCKHCASGQSSAVSVAFVCRGEGQWGTRALRNSAELLERSQFSSLKCRDAANI